MTPKQRLFAEKNHKLVYAFLAAKGLNADEFYDIVVFGYLRAVRRFLSEPKLQNYQFSTIAWRCMQVDLDCYHRKQHRKMRTAEIVSLQDVPYEKKRPLEQLLVSPDPGMMQLELKFLLLELAGRISKRQMELIYLRLYGYSVREIARKQKLQESKIRAELLAAKPALKKLCGEESETIGG